MPDKKTLENLSSSKCTPCQGGVDPLSPDQISEYICALSEGWEVIDNKKIQKSYKFKNFAQALEFTNKIGSVAEDQQHHPDIFLTWGKVTLTLWTHKIKGLHENDFILAAHADKIYNK